MPISLSGVGLGVLRQLEEIMGCMNSHKILTRLEGCLEILGYGET